MRNLVRHSSIQMVLLLGAMLSAHGEGIPREILDKTVEQAEEEHGYHGYRRAAFSRPSSIHVQLRMLYQSPINFEWSYIDEAGRPHEQPEIIRSLLSSTSTLRDILTNMESLSNGLLEVKWIEGSLCLVNPSSNYDKSNALDIVIDLEVSKVSTWEALKQWARAVIDGGDGSREFALAPKFVGFPTAPPDIFAKDDSVSVSLRSVPARDVLCTIFRESPLRLSYTYHTYWYPEKNPDWETRPRSYVTIDLFYDRAEFPSSKQFLTREEDLEWGEEMLQATSENYGYLRRLTHDSSAPDASESIETSVAAATAEIESPTAPLDALVSDVDEAAVLDDPPLDPERDEDERSLILPAVLLLMLTAFIAAVAIRYRSGRASAEGE